jgi:hypothetical protein
MKKSLNIYLVMSAFLLSTASVDCSVSSARRSAKETVVDRAAQIQSSVKKAANSSITFIAGHKVAVASSIVATIVGAYIVNELRNNDAFRHRMDQWFHIGLGKKQHRPISQYMDDQRSPKYE